jgi:hypothetical protein
MDRKTAKNDQPDCGRVAAVQLSARPSNSVFGTFAGFALLSARSTSSGVDKPVGYLAYVSDERLVIDAGSLSPRIVQEEMWGFNASAGLVTAWQAASPARKPG